MSSLETNFNIAPFYDDFDEEKNFHRILFRPAVPIQARELTQLQTILQNQVERFGDNIYKQGTIIKGCTLTYDYNYEFIKINDLQVDGQTAIPSNYSNLYAVHTPSDLKGVVVNYRSGLESQDPDTNILYLKYLNTGSGQKKRFANSDTITLYEQDYRLTSVRVDGGGSLYSNDDFLIFTGSDGSGAAANVVTYTNGSIRTVSFTSFGSGYITAPTVTVNTATGSGATLTAINYVAQVTVCNSSFTANGTTPVGKGTAVTVSDGVIYQKGAFVRVDQQTTIVDKFTPTPNAVSLGFYTQESIVNNSVDSTLLDNAQGYSNYTAPGAYRLKLTPILKAVPTADAVANSDFLRIVEFENGRVTKRKTETEFNSIDKKLSQRTAEESGDYVVSPFTLSVEAISGNTTHLRAIVGPGVGYVDGTRVELNDSVRIPLRKGTDTTTASQQSIATNYGNYFIVKESLGVFDFSSGASVNLRNTAGTDVTDNFGGSATTPGSIIGTANIRSVEYNSGTVGTPGCTYRVYLFNIKMSTGSRLADVRSIQASGAVADVVLTDGKAVLTDTDFDALVFPTGYASVNSISNADFIYRTVSTNTISTSGNTTIQLSGAYDTFPYTAGSTLNSVQESEFVVIPTANAVSTVALSGTVTTSGNVVTGVSTSFVSQLDVGDYIKFSGNVSIFRVTAITNSTSMTVNNTGPSPSLSANTLTIAYPANVPIRLDRAGANVQIGAQGNTATINIGSAIGSSAAVKVIHNVKVSPGTNIIHKAKTVVKDVFIKLSTSALSQSTTGPWSLGIPDVFKLKGVYVGTSNTYVDTTTNRASSFTLATGQTDNLYGLSSLKLKPGSSLSLTGSNCLLVKVDVFTHGSGYYLIPDSYPVDDATNPLPANRIRTEDIPVHRSPKTGATLSLRDVVDFRPIVANTANVSTTIAGATVDPSSTETLAGSIYFPTPNEIFEGDIQYFMPRADRVVLDRFGNFTISEGIPSNKPVPAKVPDKSMLLGTVLVPPYPSLSPKQASDARRPDYATLVKFDQVKRYTMKDIKQIEERLKNLEYYSLLNTLEKDTKDLVIPSESNTSISRFKNGFFVDPMNSYDICNVNDLEFNFFIDTVNSFGRPPVEKATIDLELSTGESTNYKKTGDLVTLNYTDAEALKQPLATRFRNLAQLAWGYEGTLKLFPEYDNYYDTTTKSVKFTFDLSTPLNNLINTINDSVQFKKDSSSVTVKQSDWVNVGPRWWDGGQNQLQTSTQTTTTTSTTGSIVAGSTVSSDQNVGDFISAFDFNPFIRGQYVYFMATGLRPGAKHYVFFDKTPVQVRPGEVIDLSLITDSQSLEDNDAFKFTSTTGSDLVANSSGAVAGAIYIPGGTFNVGQREILITDVDDVDSFDTSISKAAAFFNAYNFTKEVSNLTMVTKQPSSFSQVTKTNTTVESTPLSRVRRWDPLAQTFNINFNDGTDGCFLTKFDLFFKQKSSTTGLTVQIRETVNGVPSPVILAQKVLKSSNVSVSDNGQTPTTVVLDTPVFVRNDKDYCIALLPDGNSPDWLVWTSVPGQPDVATNQVDNGDFGVGVLFLSSNDRVWTPIQNEDLKFTVYYAKFNQNNGVVALRNRPYEFLTLTSTEGSFTIGEQVAQKSNSYITAATLTGNTTSAVVNTSTSLTSTISAGDRLLFVFGENKTSARAGTVTNTSPVIITGSGTDFVTDYDVGDYIYIGTSIREVVAIANTTQLTIDAPLAASATGAAHYGITESYQVNRVVSVNSIAITCKDYLEKTIDNNTVVVGLQKVVSGIVDTVGDNNTLTLKNSNASNTTFLFQSSKKVVGSTSGATAEISSVDDFIINYVEPHVSSIIPNPSTLSLKLNIAGTTASAANQDISFGISNKTNYEAEVRSRSNEIANFGGAKSLRLFASMTKPASSDKISPVVDISPASIVGLRNRINNSSANETTRYGNAEVKYVSKQVVLANGLDAEDMKVYLTAYKPPGTSVLVYGKVLSADDSSEFENKDWTLLNQDTEANLFSDLGDDQDYIEYEYSIPRTPPSTRLAGRVATSSNTTIVGTGTTFTTDFTSGDLIKIVNTSTETDYEINVVGSVTNNTVLTLSSASGPYSNNTATGFTVEKVDQKSAAFKYWSDEGIVRYYDTDGSSHSTYKIFAIKVVLLSSSTQNVPLIKDVRALAVSV